MPLVHVSYIKAIDVWVVSSLIFVFSAFLEFAYVNVLARRGDKEVTMAQVFMCKQQDDSVHSQCDGGVYTPYSAVWASFLRLNDDTLPAAPETLGLTCNPRQHTELGSN
ncbi:hypothetical protein C0Q70_05455 [Pomacea canaliculata]|uniref:Neurotransmitter-gated ion-channel transmembrane domain-containing protein n=1 Tax=Pomacea canaliculata TaxID=400727 RepID=A0A2T7PL93_POMCA|nr:hypothetical protein C0Q70_05455 [Pomacea canaliculata]